MDWGIGCGVLVMHGLGYWLWRLGYAWKGLGEVALHAFSYRTSILSMSFVVLTIYHICTYLLT